MNKARNYVNELKKAGIKLDQKDWIILEGYLKKIIREETEIAADKVFIKQLAIPLNVLTNEDYFGDRCKEIGPKFIEDVLTLADTVDSGHVTYEQLVDVLNEFGDLEVTAPWLNVS